MEPIANTAELAVFFREIDRADVDTQGLTFPLTVEDALTWEAGPRAFVLLRDRPGARLKGMVFHRNHSPTPQVATMCHWCHRVRGNGGVKLLTVRTDARHTVGQYLCSDLSCLSQEDVADIDGLRETLDPTARRGRTVERMRSFAARRLF